MYRLLAAVFLGAGLLVGSFFTGARYEKNKVKVEGYKVFAAEVRNALDIADSFVKLGTEFVNKKSEIREVTKTVVQRQVKYVTDNNVPDCVVPEYIMQLRECQINRVRKAAGYSVSGRSDGTLCTPGAPEQPEGSVRPHADLKR